MGTIKLLYVYLKVKFKEYKMNNRYLDEYESDFQHYLRTSMNKQIVYKVIYVLPNGDWAYTEPKHSEYITLHVKTDITLEEINKIARNYTSPFINPF